MGYSQKVLGFSFARRYHKYAESANNFSCIPETLIEDKFRRKGKQKHHHKKRYGMMFL